MKKKLLAVISMIILVATPLTMGVSTVDAAPKANSQKVVAKSETYPTLRIGSRSSYVKNLQQSLTDVKYHTSVDGIFGSKTQTMVKQFQSDHNLSPDGIVGRLTWAALDQNKVERKQFTVDAAIALSQKKLLKNIVFSRDRRLVKDSEKQSYYPLKKANKDYIDKNLTVTVTSFHIYKHSLVVDK